MPWVTDDIFVAGGEFVSDYWPDFQAQAGVGLVLTLGLDKPGIFVEPAPWAVLWLPVAAEASWTVAQLMLGVQFLSAAAQAQRPCLIHTPAGLHRARPVVAAYQLAQGHSLARVLREVTQKPWQPPYQGDVAVLETWLQQFHA